ncbi:hypothetical protein [Marinobacter vinifirmus]|uniref:Uncharacterized protein n=1 Tax=Marinobacter vinifirmus TaxID=355591 RepID=A0A558BCM5_9GAMM|nr:hypothetical protein [Marinobacter vinifirmus]TVT34266.1 MAG: hypothetical protein FHK81_06490 [Marinobacter vinifirmus]
MNSATIERNWLFDPSLLKLVHQCRRLIQSEFGVKLHLNEADLAEHLAEYAAKTRSTHLVHTWEALKQRVPELSAETEEESVAPRMYRGQPIAESQQVKGSSEGEPCPRQKKVIYRGQVVG